MSNQPRTRWTRVWIRDAIYLTAYLLACPWLAWRWWRRRSVLQQGWRLRFRQKLFGLSLPQSRHACDTQLIWLHGVSVGEVQLLSELRKRLGVDYPKARFVLSTTTVAGMEVANKLASNTECFYFPLDFSWAVKRVFNVLRPQILVLGELELWPNLIDIADRYEVPIVVVNGRLSQRSFLGYQRFSWFTKPMFRKLQHVAAQSEEYAERFRRCGCPTEHVTVTGNLKFDNVAFDAEHEQVDHLRKLTGIVPPSIDRGFAPESNCRPEAEAGKNVAKSSLLVLGSSQEPEERATVDAFTQLRKSHERLKLIVVPRHPDRFSAVGMWLDGIPVKVQRRSALANCISADSWDILLVDTVGELRWWWGLADIAIVGGSFGDRGGQNMIEPAAYGANVAFGPNTSNFRDVTQLLLQAHAATRLPSTEAILPWLRSELSDPKLGKQRGQLARELIASQQGATRRTIQVLRTVLPPARSGRQSAA